MPRRLEKEVGRNDVARRFGPRTGISAIKLEEIKRQYFEDATPENLRQLSKAHRIPLNALIGHIAGPTSDMASRLVLKYGKKE